MKKLIGVQCEVNVTMDEEIVKAVGKGIERGSVHIEELYKDLKQTIVDALKKEIKGGKGSET